MVHDLERYLNTLGTIAAISPLLGLLGTVTGMIRTFKAITIAGVGNPTALAGGIAEALITHGRGPDRRDSRARGVPLPARPRGRARHRHGKGIASSSCRPSIARAARGRDRRGIAPRRKTRREVPAAKPEDPDLNMTSLIDVVLLLLIFFMMSTKFIDEGRLQVRLPEAGVAAGRGGRSAIGRDRGDRGGRLPRRRPAARQQQPRHARHRDSARRPAAIAPARHDPRRRPRHAPVGRHRDGRRRAARLPADQHRNGSTMGSQGR